MAATVCREQVSTAEDVVEAESYSGQPNLRLSPIYEYPLGLFGFVQAF